MDCGRDFEYASRKSEQRVSQVVVDNDQHPQWGMIEIAVCKDGLFAYRVSLRTVLL